MNTLEIDRHPVAVNVSVTEATLEVELADGRKISAPIVWFPRLEAASEEERSDWQLLGMVRASIGRNWMKILVCEGF